MIRVYKRILVPIDVEHDDGMVNALSTLDLARRIGADDATLICVGVVPPSHDVPAVFEDKWRGLVTKASRQLDLLVAAGIGDGEEMEGHIVSHEDVAGELMRAAERFEADLIVMSSHRRHGMARLSASAAEKVSRDASVAVVLFREPENER
jgi:nucleotide-binding universal stress UspA family protein